MNIAVVIALLLASVPVLLALLVWAALRERQLRRQQREAALRAPELAAGYLVDVDGLMQVDRP
ncbi:hypothetical protein [Luteococcus peritonei]|uniref:Uncharacterized protein n=1 Tax=Luteococcus peritonei TaxID=88874 RepID=A0ABW4RVY3_9ACTN